MAYWVIDRFEGNLAVCEAQDGSFVHIGRDKLPDGAAEGSVLRLDGDGCYILDRALEEARRREIIELERELFGNGKPE
ncbi:MAG: DUF3006 domain-containing protein [Clostridiales bacterium]|nr:DUF3006 domain-containing protein [Clostridiales bacterium]